MKILVISDVHANLTALEAVLDRTGEMEAVWCLGDLVGYGPDPNECIQRIQSIPHIVCLLGNHDAAVLGEIDLESFNMEARQSAQWVKKTILPENLEYLSKLNEITTVKEVTLAHGSPRNPVWEYLLDTYSAASNFDHFSTRLCFVGHTHLPIAYQLQNGSKIADWKLLKDGDILELTERAIINPGSVGQPRDHDPRAAYAIYDDDTNTWEAHRVEYDIKSVQKRITTAGLPRRHAMRLADGW